MLPPEILDIVFVTLLESRDWDDFRPQYAYHALLLVNHHWHNVAIRHLYHTIAANSHLKSQNLLETLENHPDIAALVRGARLGTLIFKRSQDSAHIHAKIIAKCPNVNKIWVTGCGGFFNTLMGGIKLGTKLEEILLSRSDSEEGSDDLVLCQSRNFVENLPRWPRLGHLSFYGPVLCDESDEFRLRSRLLDPHGWNTEDTFFDSESSTPSSPNQNLRQVRFMENAITFTEHGMLPNLTVLAPCVEALSIHYRNWHAQLHAPYLKTSLGRWSSHLRELYLTSSGGYITSSMPPRRPSIDDVFLQLTALRILDISSFFLLLHTLVRTTAPIERLIFWDHLRTGDIICNELGQYLENEDVLPSLRLLQTRRCNPPKDHPVRNSKFLLLVVFYDCG
uniref:F-box domain-containing protein n=1 Tax=Moniliophthora roreri TaxID=221103 RepID=A0A0W0EVQ4_MONRR